MEIEDMYRVLVPGEMSERIQGRQVLDEREVEMTSQEECSSSDTTESSSDDGGGGAEASPRGDDVEKGLTGSGSRSTATPPHDNDVEKK